MESTFGELKQSSRHVRHCRGTSQWHYWSSAFTKSVRGPCEK